MAGRLLPYTFTIMEFYYLAIRSYQTFVQKRLHTYFGSVSPIPRASRSPPAALRILVPWSDNNHAPYKSTYY